MELVEALQTDAAALPGAGGQPDAEPGFSAVPGHQGEHGAAGPEDEVSPHVCVSASVLVL